MDFLIIAAIALGCFVVALICTVIIGPLYCYGCGRFPDNKLSFCSDCIREGKRRYSVRHLDPVA
jgi:hypothetical protein